MDKCNYQVIIKDFPYYCCDKQKYYSLVVCPNNYSKCPIYSQEYNTDTSAEYPK